MAPRSWALGEAARVTAWRRFPGPSALMAVEGLIAPTITMGLLHSRVMSTVESADVS